MLIWQSICRKKCLQFDESVLSQVCWLFTFWYPRVSFFPRHCLVAVKTCDQTITHLYLLKECNYDLWYIHMWYYQVVFSKHATVKLLVAYWAHNIKNTDVYLKSLLYSNNLCTSSPYNKCSGKVEIKYYVVPGFNLTGPAIKNGSSTGNIYPGFTRVNHGKYAVSDIRAHIGTSNLIWDYFYATAGVSFGTYNPAIVSQLQEIFDADWYSPYAIPVEALNGGYSYSS